MARCKKWLLRVKSIIAIFLQIKVLDVPTLLPTQLGPKLITQPLLVILDAVLKFWMTLLQNQLGPKLVTQPLFAILDYRGLDNFVHYFRDKIGYYGAVQKVALRVKIDHCNNPPF